MSTKSSNSNTETSTPDEKCVLARTLENITSSLVNEHQGVEIKCHVCKKKTKGGLTLFNFYSKHGKIYWKNKVLSCSHIDWDGEPGCSCCHTIRDGHPVCGSCAGWDVMSGGITNAMKKHNFTWVDGTVSAWKHRPGLPYHQFQCDCGHIKCFEHEKDKEEYHCPCKNKRNFARLCEDLQEENDKLKAKLAKIENLLK